MRTDEFLDGVREKAVIGDANAWTDWPDSRLLVIGTQRHQALVSDELVKANSGYGNQEALVTCTAGVDLYPLPDRSVGNTLRMLEYAAPGTAKWEKLERVDVPNARNYDRGPSYTQVPQRYAVKDGWVEVYPSPPASYVLRQTFFIRPSALAPQQSAAVNGGVVRGLISNVNKVARTFQVNVLPKDMLATGTPDITNASLIDIIHPGGNFNLAMYSQPISISGTTITLTSSDDMTRVRNGDFVRVAEQSDWPTNFPPEFHQLLIYRTAMDVLGSTGRGEDAAELGLTVTADLQRFRSVIKPQVKNAPVRIPLIPMGCR